MIFSKRCHSALMIASLAGAFCFASTGSYAGDLTLTPEQQASLGIEVTTLKPVSEYASRSYPAEAIVPLSQVTLVTTPVSGLITQIFHVHGPIQAGDIIAEIQSPSLLSAQKNYLNTLSDLQTAKYNLKRAQKLTQNGVVSVKNKQQAEADVNKLSQIRLQQREDLAYSGMDEDTIRKLEKTRKQQSTIHIKATKTGELFNLKAKVGERLAADAPIISIGQTNPIVVHVKVPTGEVNALSEGMKVSLTGYDKVGEIAHISSFVDPMTQTVEVHTKFVNDAPLIRPGQLLQVHFIESAKDGETLYQCPSSAIASYDGKDVVFLMNDNQPVVIPVKILSMQDKTLVFKPLAPIPANSQVVYKSTSSIKSALSADSGE